MGIALGPNQYGKAENRQRFVTVCGSFGQIDGF